MNFKWAKLQLKIFKEVPKWNVYFPSLSKATPEQRKFYNYWLKQLKKGNFLDIKGNLSYVFVYLYSVIDYFRRNKDITHLLECFEGIKKGYGKYQTIRDYLTIWTADAYFCLGKYNKTLKFCYSLNSGLPMNNILNIKAQFTHERMTGEDLLIQAEHQLFNYTLFTKEHFNLIAKRCDEKLRKWEEGNGQEFLAYIAEKYKSQGIYAFQNSLCYEEKDQTAYCFYSIREFSKFVVQTARDSENELRKEIGFPAIGEGWISETELYYKIKKWFKDYKVVHHAHPIWLGRQHLDIFIPELKLAIEYQGAQHFRPIKFFGGEKAFRKIQESDRRKKYLCNKNSVALIYVLGEDNKEQILKKLKLYLNNI